MFKLLFTGFLLALSLSAQSSFGISMGKNNDLEERVKTLEREVSDLKSEVRSLRDRPLSQNGPVIVVPGSSVPLAPAAPVQVPVKTYACFVETSFKGTFTGKGESKNEAKGKALKACTDGGGGLSCSARDVKCDD